MKSGVKSWLLVLFPLLALTAMASVVATRYVIEKSDDGDFAARTTIASAVLGERRTYAVHLPASYAQAPKRRYPVIYVLDAPSQDAHTAASAALMASIGAMPEVIVVGIDNLDGDSRARDFTPPGMHEDSADDTGKTGRADRFLAFIRDELMPGIDKGYRTSPSRTLAGWSRGGLFVVYALTEEPALFEAYIANSPAMWRDDDEMVLRLGRFLQAGPAPKASLFLSLGTAENNKMKGAFGRTVAVLQAKAPASLRWHRQFTPGATHGDNPRLATPVALRWSYDPRWEPARIAQPGG